tara:strand:+ start:1052 stop:2743 length:1692 start_codon:yes stop_codon:yes gene_type:complete
VRDLEIRLKRLDGQNYGKYKTLQTTWKSGLTTCRLAHIQGDPYASSSTLSIIVALNETEIPPEYYSDSIARKVLADFIYREASKIVGELSENNGDGHSGEMFLGTIGPEVLSRSAIQVSETGIEMRVGVGLPGEGRKIMGMEAIELLTFKIPELWTRCCYWRNMDKDLLKSHLKVVRDQETFRGQLEEKSLVSWIANGSMLARAEGNSVKVLTTARPFKSPKSLEIIMRDSDNKKVLGMGIPKGLTLIAGGGYHGKSTLLHAIEHGIYNHLPGDGREKLVTHMDSAKIRSEEGRSIQRVDLSAFLGTLPQNQSPTNFSTTNASGSTSQFANLMECIEAGATKFFIDEDLSAVNALVRDERMQALLYEYSEPIIPLIDRIPLLKNLGHDFVMVVGASGMYLDHADTVIVMNDYSVFDGAEGAKKAIAEYPTLRAMTAEIDALPELHRVPNLKLLHAKLYGMQDWPKVRAQGTHVLMGDLSARCGAWDQLAHQDQLRTMAHSFSWLIQKHADRGWSLEKLLSDWSNAMEQGGLDTFHPHRTRELCEIRKVDLAMFINRISALSVI